MRLKITDLKQKLGAAADPQHTDSSEEESSEEEIETKKVSRKARAGVSAEVFGEYNKKEDFVAKVIIKTDDLKSKLKKRLL